MNFLAGPKWDVTKELTDIKVASEGRETYHVRLRDFSVSTVLKPFLIALTLMFFFQMTGINVILQYTVDIFKSADSSVEKFQVRNLMRPKTIIFINHLCICPNSISNRKLHWFFTDLLNYEKRKKGDDF